MLTILLIASLAQSAPAQTDLCDDLLASPGELQDESAIAVAEWCQHHRAETVDLPAGAVVRGQLAEPTPPGTTTSGQPWWFVGPAAVVLSATVAAASSDADHMPAPFDSVDPFEDETDDCQPERW